MKSILFVLIALSLGAQARADWKSGPENEFELHSNRGADSFTSLPVFGLDRAPLLGIPVSLRRSAAMIRPIADVVPRDEEIAQLLGLGEREFTERAAHFLESMRQISPIGKGTGAQQRAWGVINREKAADKSLRFKLRTFYQPIDFELVSSVGEGGDRRSFCVAGFRVRVEFELVGVSIPENPELNRAARGAIGTVFKADHPYLVGQSYLGMKIDLGPEEGREFARECKAVKDTLH